MDANLKSTGIKSHFDDASCMSKLTFSWIGKLLWQTYRNTLNNNIVYDAPKQLKTSNVDIQFQRVQKRHSTQSLWIFLARMILWECFILSVIIVVEHSVAIIVRAHFLGTFVLSFSMNNEDRYFWFFRYGSAIILVASLLIFVFIVPLVFFFSEVLGLKLKVAVTSLVYNKLLRVIAPELKKVDIGHMLNVFSSDVAKFEMIGYHLFGRILSIIPLLGSVIYIQLTTGIAGTVGFIVMIVVAILSSFNLFILKHFGRKKARLTDQRLKLTTKLITEVRTMKLFCLEATYQQLIERIRKRELRIIFILSSSKLVFQVVVGILASIAILVTLYMMVYTQQPIVPRIIFSTYAVFNALQIYILVTFARVVENTSFLIVALRRVKEFLNLNEYMKTDNSRCISKSVIMRNVTSSWYFNSNYVQSDGCFFLKLSEIILQNPSLTMAIGPVGSGKSTLLMTMIKEMYIASGEVYMGGSVTYMPQEPWLFPSTIKQNITFGLPFDQQRYDIVIFNCALRQDFEILAHGDQTVVDDKALTLSGGQFARISLARAMYRDSDIYLLDDPLSAVDVNVGKHIWKNCFMSAKKIVVLVSHSIQFISDCTNVIYVDNGIASFGKYDEMKLSNINQRPQDTVDDHMKVKIDSKSPDSKDKTIAPIDYKESEGNALLMYCKMISPWCGGYLVLVGAFLLIAVCPIANIIFTIYMSKWVYFENHFHSNGMVNFTGEAIMTLPQLTYLIIATVMLLVVPYIVFFYIVYLASHRMHKQMLNSIMRTNLSFFHKHHAGTVLNRFSKDVEIIDDIFPNHIYLFTFHGLLQLGIYVVAIYSNYIVVVPLIISLIILLFVFKLYVKGVEPIKQMEANARSPLYTYMNCTVKGLSVIHSHNNEELVKKEFQTRQDNHSSAVFLILGMSNWIGLVSQILGTIVPSSIVIISLIWPQFTDSSKVGIGVASAFLATLKLAFVVKVFSDANQQILSVKRIKEYIELPSEAGYDIDEKYTPSGWPSCGLIVFENLSLGYGTTKKYALKNLSFQIKPGEKIGIVGRTGAGKSSLVAALFRLASTEGTITIDGINIATLPLIKYREKLSIIPQNPAILFGSVRNNLDPSNKYRDEELWQVLESVQMKDTIKDLEDEMDKFSVGQKQLFCLARTLLEKNKIIILDEATSNVDNKTDEIISKLIRTQFTNSTMLIIAHRLQTVIDLDKIMVIQNGEILEFESPDVLLRNPDSIFNSMTDTFTRL
ncbi:hypothetical protein CHUAL_013884 [Chamberlinius hualienensis]